MSLLDLPVNFTGAVFSFCWFMTGFWAAKSINELKSSSIPANLKPCIVLFCPVMGLIGAVLFFYFQYSKKITEYINQKNKKNNEKKQDLIILDEHGRDMLQKNGGLDGAYIVKNLIWDALESKTSDIFIDPKNESYLIRLRVDGFIRVHSTLPEREALPVISMFKVFSGMDIAEKRRPQDGSFNALYKGTGISFRVATVGVYGGEKITIRVIASESGNRSLKDIGLSTTQYKGISTALKLPSGMILICGPTGSGKTSSMYAMISSIDYGQKNVISIEDPVERVVPNISQIEVNTKAGITFAAVLRNSLRQNPDVICLGEIRDEETATIAAQAAQTGHLIIATLHSNDNIGTLVRLTDLGIPLRNIAAALQMSISQRLIRKLCPHCKRNAELDEAQKAYCMQYNIPFESIKEPAGCPKCGGTGYAGRLAVFELLVMDDDLRRVLETPGSTITDVKDYVEAHLGTDAMGSRIMSLVIKGETSWEEYERATVNL